MIRTLLLIIVMCLATWADEAPALANGIYVLDTAAPAAGTASVTLTVGTRTCYALTPPLVADQDMRGAKPSSSPLGFAAFVELTGRAKQALNAERAKVAGGQRLLYVVLGGALRGPFSMDSAIAAGDPLYVIFTRLEPAAANAALAAFNASRPPAPAGTPAAR
jgi:hypothetical protein